MHVKDAHDFVLSIKYHFSPIFSKNKIFSNEIELLFVKSRRTRFNLDVLYSFDTYFQLVVSKHNYCMNFLVVTQPCDIIASLSEVYVRILTNQIVSISNDLLLMSGEYGLSTMCEKRNLFLDSSASFICGFYFDMCKLLRADSFVYMYQKFLPNVIISLKHLRLLINLVYSITQKRLISKYVYENIFTYSQEIFE